MTQQDWLLLLSFVKAIAAPAATVLAVTMAALLAVRGYRYQKLLERRLEWYESMHEHIHLCSMAYAKAHRLKTDEAVEECNRLMGTTRALAARAGLYAEQSGFDAATAWIRALPRIDDDTILEVNAFADECSLLAQALFREVRRDLKLARLRVPWAD